jgi:PAS domain S-box-containing protein
VINPSLSAETWHLRGLFMQAPSFMCVLRGRGHVFELVNPAFLKLVGGRDLLGKPMREGLPELVNQDYLGLLDGAFRTREAFVGRKMRVLFQKQPDGGLEEYFLDFVCQPIIGVKNKVKGIFIVGNDVTDHVHAEQRQAILIRELHHRVRNTLAIVQGVMTTTARSSVTIEAFQEAFAGRIASLAKTHSVLTEELEQSVSFLHLLKQELEPYCDRNGGRIHLDGPFVELPSQIAVPLGMAIHELTTNAAKHGALGHEKGRVEVDWSVVTRNNGRALLCEWREHNGPPVSLPTFDGFGSLLLNRVLSQQIGAEVDVEFDTKGFHLRMVVPLCADRPRLFHKPLKRPR